MSATKPRRELVSPDSRRRPGAKRSAPPRLSLVDGEPLSAPGPPADGTHRAPDPPPAPMPAKHLEHELPSETWWDFAQRTRLAREGRLRSLWQMSPAQRVAAMRRGDLTYEQLAAWTARYRDEIPMVNGEFEWIAARLPEVCE